MVTKVEPIEVLLKNAQNEFRSRFNYEPTIFTAAPGRVNLIGEHIDYNDGFVLPMVRSLVLIALVYLFIYLITHINYNCRPQRHFR